MEVEAGIVGPIFFHILQILLPSAPASLRLSELPEKKNPGIFQTSLPHMRGLVNIPDAVMSSCTSPPAPLPALVLPGTAPELGGLPPLMQLLAEAVSIYSESLFSRTSPPSGASPPSNVCRGFFS